MGIGFWLRWSARDLRRRLVQVVAIAAILGLGSAIYSGLGSTSAWREASLHASLEQFAVHDVRVSLLGDTVIDMDQFVPAVRDSVSGSSRADEVRLVVRTPVTAHDTDGTPIPAAGELVGVDLSKPQSVDRWSVVAGRTLRPDDAGTAVALLDQHFAQQHDLPETGTLRVDGTDVDYVGLALAPDRLNLTTTSGDVVQGQATRAVLWSSIELARQIRDTNGGVSEVVISLGEGADTQEVAANLTKDLATDLPGVPLDVTTRSEDRSLTALTDEIASEQRVFDVFALLVLGGAAFAAFGLTKRVVESQRRDIGIAMSLGLPRSRIAIRSGLFALEVTTLGVLFGIAAGVAISRWVLSIIERQVPLPMWETPFQVGLFARAALAALLIPLAAAAVPILRAVRSKPVDAFLPPNLRSGAHRLSALMRRLRLPGSMLLQAPLRRVLGAPVRAVVTIVSVALVMAPLLAALGAGDSATATIDASDAVTRGSGTDRLLVSLIGYAPEGSDVVRAIEQAPGVGRFAIGLDTGGYLHSTRDYGDEIGVSISMGDLDDPLEVPPSIAELQLPPGGIVVSRKAADDLGVAVGDDVVLRHPRRDGTTFTWVEDRIPVRALHPSPYRFVAYMDLTDRSLFGLEGLIGSLKLQPTDATSMSELQSTVAELPGVASALPASAASATTKDLLSMLRELFLVLQAVIAALAFLVAFNASRVAADERRRENATMFAFGIPVRRVLGMEAGESLMLGSIGVLLGLGLGAAMLQIVMATVFPAAAPDLAFRQVISPSSYVITIAIALAATATAPLLNVRSLRRMNLPSTLRYVE